MDKERNTDLRIRLNDPKIAIDYLKCDSSKLSRNTNETEEQSRVRSYVDYTSGMAAGYFSSLAWASRSNDNQVDDEYRIRFSQQVAFGLVSPILDAKRFAGTALQLVLSRFDEGHEGMSESYEVAKNREPRDVSQLQEQIEEMMLRSEPVAVKKVKELKRTTPRLFMNFDEVANDFAIRNDSSNSLMESGKVCI